MREAMSARGHLPARLTLVAALGATAAGQEPSPAAAAPPLSGWLHELLDGDVVAAMRTYEAAMQSTALAPAERALAAQRLLEIARLRGDRAAVERCLVLADAATRASYGRRKNTPDAALELRTALTAGDPARLAEARRRFVQELESNSSLRADFGLPSSLFPATLEATSSNPAPSGKPVRASTSARLRLPLPPPRSASQELRLRATQIADLRLRQRAEEARRLEADIVARLIGEGGDDAFVGTAPAERSEANPAARLEQCRLWLSQLLESGQLTPRELGVLGAVRDQLQRLEQAGQPEQGLRLLRELPYELSG